MIYYKFNQISIIFDYIIPLLGIKFFRFWSNLVQLENIF